MDKTIPSQLPLLGQFVEELCSVEQIILSSGRVDVESKIQMKRRGMKSPNLADAFILTFGRDGAIGAGSFKHSKWGDVDTKAYRAPGFR
jgi:hypothetical protein